MFLWVLCFLIPSPLRAFIGATVMGSQHSVSMVGLAMLSHVCYYVPMTTKTDALIHLPNVNAGPWKHFRVGYERRVSFNCDHGQRQHAVLKVSGNGEDAALITVMIVGVTRELSVGEYADPFSTANETLVAFARDCGCRTDTEGDAL